MLTMLRRMFWLSLLAGAGYAGWTAWQSRDAGDDPAPEWPPLDPPEPASTPATEQPWVAPVDGACPDGYPIKANANSGIFHVPGGRFYDRTVPERCYADAVDAEADGYRRAKA